MAETIESQDMRVLAEFEKAKNGLTTKEIHEIPYCANPTARISNLRKRGVVISCAHIPGTNSSRYVLVSRPDNLTTLAKSARRGSVMLTVLPSGIEVWSK